MQHISEIKNDCLPEPFHVLPINTRRTGCKDLLEHGITCQGGDGVQKRGRQPGFVSWTHGAVAMAEKLNCWFRPWTPGDGFRKCAASLPLLREKQQILGFVQLVPQAGKHGTDM